VAIIADCGPAAHDASPGSIAPRSRADLRPTLTRWGYVAALVVGVPALLVNAGGRDGEALAQLERLAPRIERAQALSPEAAQTISRLIERQSVVAGAENPSRQMRRTAAIERITRAMQAKQHNAAGATVGGAISK
jgi:hypothetical protein